MIKEYEEKKWDKKKRRLISSDETITMDAYNGFSLWTWWKPKQQLRWNNMVSHHLTYNYWCVLKCNIEVWSMSIVINEGNGLDISMWEQMYGHLEIKFWKIIVEWVK